jgi:hypothetical protein
MIWFIHIVNSFYLTLSMAFFNRNTRIAITALNLISTFLLYYNIIIDVCGARCTLVGSTFMTSISS